MDQAVSCDNYSHFGFLIYLTLYLRKLLLDFLHSFPIDYELGHSFVKEPGREADIYCGFNLVTSQYPELYSCIADVSDGFLYLILQFIFDCGGSDKIHLCFEFSIDFLKCFFPPMY